MFHSTTIDADAATFTLAECEALEAVIAHEAAMRKRLLKGVCGADLDYLGIIEDVLPDVFNDIEGVDGYEDSHAKLQAALEESDCHPLWVAITSAKVAA